jgi:hypothetical protein
MIVEYVHLPLNEAVESISGRYIIDKETLIPHEGREVLVAFGLGVIDNACCGPGGCRFANVVGYLADPKTHVEKDGSPVSEVEPVVEEEARREIRRRIEKMEPYCQVNFL